MAKYVLTYFDVAGRAETSRLLFHQAGVEFEDRRIKREDWPELKKNDKVCPFGQIPVLEVDGTVISQSNAIARFLANEFGLHGKTNLEKAKGDMLIDGLSEVASKLLLAFVEPDETKKAEIKKKFYETHLPAGLKLYQDKFIPKEGFFLGDSVSFSDIQFVSLMNRCKELSGGADIFENFPLVKAFYERIRNVPNIKKYLDSQEK